MDEKNKSELRFGNLKKGEMPIMGYVEPLMFGINKNDGFDVTMDEAFDDLKNSGINTLIGVNYMLNDGNDEDIETILQKAAERGLNYLFKDRTRDKLFAGEFTQKQADNYFRTAYKRLEKYSSFAGIHYIDEPGYVDWERFRSVREGFKKTYPEKLFFINLLQTYAPHWAIPNGAVYDFVKGGGLPDDGDIEKYYDSYVKKAEPDLFSYDYYPFCGEYPAIKSDYYFQLHLAYKYAKKGGLPVSCFMQTCTFGEGTRGTTFAEKLWQVNTSIAYGTKGIAYFVYWNPYKLPHWRYSPIDPYGNKTKVYYEIVKLNEWIKKIDEYFTESELVGMIPAGKTANAEEIRKDDVIKSFSPLSSVSGDSVLAGCFAGKSGKKILFVVNNRFDKESELSLSFEKEVDLSVVCREKEYAVTDNRFRTALGKGEGIVIIVK